MPEVITSASCRPPAPAMIGTLIRNENLAASSRLSPRKRPSVIVAPERETPGTSAAAWASPIPTASPNPSLVARRLRLAAASATRNSTPTRTKLKTTTQGERIVSSKKPSNRYPIKAAGMVDAITRQECFRAGSLTIYLYEKERKKAKGNVKRA